MILFCCAKRAEVRRHPARPSGIDNDWERREAAPKYQGPFSRRKKLVATDAVAVLDCGEPVALGVICRNVALAAELAFVWDLQHRIPIDRRVVLGSRRFVRRLDGGQIELLARLAIHLWRVDEPVAAHPILGPVSPGREG